MKKFSMPSARLVSIVPCPNVSVVFEGGGRPRRKAVVEEMQVRHIKGSRVGVRGYCRRFTQVVPHFEGVGVEMR
jgi:hypothetical protein